MWQLAFCRTSAPIPRLIDSNPKQMSVNFYYPENNLESAASEVQNLAEHFLFLNTLAWLQEPQKHFESLNESECHVFSLSVLARPCVPAPVDPVPVEPSPNTCTQPAYHKIPTSLVFQSERHLV